jgi:hypothetical protein
MVVRVFSPPTIKHCFIFFFFLLQLILLSIGRIYVTSLSTSSLIFCSYSSVSEEAKLEYQKISETEINLYHTETPPSKQGRGIAALLAKVGSGRCVVAIYVCAYGCVSNIETYPYSHAGCL